MKRTPLVCICLLLVICVAACGPLAETPPTATSAPFVPLIITPAPSATAASAPSATAQAAPTQAPSPLPIQAPSATVAPATPSPVARNPKTRLGTYFFYWYDCPRHACDANELNAVPPGWDSPLPNDHDPRDGASYSSLNEDWYENELRDMRSVGIQDLFAVSWGDHPHPWFNNDTLRVLVQANGVQNPPLSIGMFLDTTAQQAMYNEYHHLGYHYGPLMPQLPLSDPMSGYFFYERHIKGFFEQIPRKMWATQDGRPIIVVYTAICCRDFQRAGALWGAVKDAFTHDFGVQPWLVLEDTWFTPEALNPPDGMRRLADVADGRYAWGAALNGPQTRSMNGYTVSSVGPGFDNRKIVGMTAPHYQSRAVSPDGTSGDPAAFFRGSLAAVPDTTDLLMIETWNEWPETTAIARARYPDTNGVFPPDDLYLQVLRHWRFGN